MPSWTRHRDAALDLGHRKLADGHDEFFVLDAEGEELASFSTADFDRGAPIENRAEWAALRWVRDRGAIINYLPSFTAWNEERSAFLGGMADRLYFGREYVPHIRL